MKKALIIIPFMEDDENTRTLQKEQLVIYINNQIGIPMVIQEQTCGLPEAPQLFNKGLLFNQAVTENPQYDYYIFHDVDLIPDKQLIPYYHKYPDNPIHLAHRGGRYGQFRRDLSGVFSMTKETFYKINGYPNDLWGWGGDDWAIVQRLDRLKIPIENPRKGKVKDLENFKYPADKYKFLERNNQVNPTFKEQMKEDITNWENNGIRQYQEKYKNWPGILSDS